MLIRADSQQIVIVETETRRVIRMTTEGGWVNERKVDALPRGYTDLVPSVHAVYPVAVGLAEQYEAYTEHREGPS